MLRNGQDSYGLPAILFHWIIAALFLCQLPLGYVMRSTGDLALQFALYQWHKSLGFLILALSLLRLGWTLSNVRPRLPDTLTALEKKTARSVHAAFYVLLVAVPLSGWAVVSASPLQIPTFAFNLFVIPHLPLEASLAAEALWTRLHAVLAYLAAAVALVHIMAALRHHFRLHDDVLMRMLRPARGRTRRGSRRVSH